MTSPAPIDQWYEVLASAPGSLPSQTPAWLRCVCMVEGYEDATRLYHAADGRRLVLPLARRRLLGSVLSVEASLPVGWGPAGLIGEHGIVLPEDVRMVFADLARRRPLRVSLRPDPATARTWSEASPVGATRQQLMAQSLSLEGGFDKVWRTRFRGDTRNRVRRAQRAGVTVESDVNGSLVPTFQRLYAQSVARWARCEGHPLALARLRAARREPAAKLRTVAANLGVHCRIYAAYVSGQPAAAIVVLLRPPTAAYWRGAMDENLAGRTYANYLLHRTAIEDAADAGCVAYHMGDSTPGSPLALFKSRFGAVEQHYASYRLERIPITPIEDRISRGVVEILKRRRGQVRP